MQNYKKEEMKFLNMNRTDIYVSNPNNINGYQVFKIEKEFTLEEKISFIDKMEDGIASYLIALIEKWEMEKDELPQSSGSPKTVSKKAWIKRNDTRNIIDNDYKIGRYHVLRTAFSNMTLTCPTTEYGHSYAFTGQHVAHQWFHDLCNKLHYQEQEYFKSIDPKSIMLNEVEEMGDKFGTCFNNKELNDIVWNRKIDVEMKNLQLYLDAYKKLEDTMTNIERELNEIHSQ